MTCDFTSDIYLRIQNKDKEFFFLSSSDYLFVSIPVLNYNINQIYIKFSFKVIKQITNTSRKCKAKFIWLTGFDQRRSSSEQFTWKIFYWGKNFAAVTMGYRIGYYKQKWRSMTTNNIMPTIGRSMRNVEVLINWIYTINILQLLHTVYKILQFCMEIWAAVSIYWHNVPWEKKKGGVFHHTHWIVQRKILCEDCDNFWLWRGKRDINWHS